jgi:hypothetical protein
MFMQQIIVKLRRNSKLILIRIIASFVRKCINCVTGLRWLYSNIIWNKILKT